MKKRDLKKMALLGLATGLLLANQGTVEAQAPEASSNEGEFLAGLTQEGQLIYQSLNAEGQHMARLIVSHDCGANDGLGGCNDAGCYTTTGARGDSGAYGAGGATGWNAGCGSGCGTQNGPRGTYLASAACGGSGSGCGGGGSGHYYGGGGGSCGGGGGQQGGCGGGGAGYYYGGSSSCGGSGLPASCGGGSSCKSGYEPPRGLKSGKPDNQMKVQGQPKNMQKNTKSSSGIKDSNMQQQQSYQPYQPYQQQRNS